MSELVDKTRKFNKVYESPKSVLLELLKCSDGSNIAQDLKVLSEELAKRGGKLEEGEKGGGNKEEREEDAKKLSQWSWWFAGVVIAARWHFCNRTEIVFSF